MSHAQARRDKIGRRYGEVLFGLAQQTKTLKAVSADLPRLESLLNKDQNAWTYLKSPMASLRLQKSLLEKLSISLKLSRLTYRFLLVLCQNRRLSYLFSAFEAFREKQQSLEEGVEGLLESATPLSAKEIKDLEKSLEDKIGHPVSLRQEVKESLIAGVVIHLGSHMIDVSLKAHLNQLQQAMKG